MDTMTFPGTGRRMLARILRPGDSYGLEGCLTWGRDEKSLVDPKGEKLGIEFYDTTYHPGLGQFVSRYYLDTILKSQGGLCLQGDVPAWDIPDDSMNEVRTWASKFI